jgi:putative endopeptidase
VLSGQPEPDARWRVALEDTSGQLRPLSDALGREYVQRYVPVDARPAAQDLVGNILKAFDGRLAKLEWMSESTRQGAQEKLRRLTVKTLYPDAWLGSEGLEVVRGDAIGNARRAAAFTRKRELGWITSNMDRRMFLQPVYVVNAYALSEWNEIVFLAAIMRPPFFDPKADPAVNYGAIGAVIGHEISHLFDDNGRLSDGQGLLRDWWTEADAQRFTATSEQLAKQVSAYEVLPGKFPDGKLTLGESIADVAGLTVALDAYRRSLGGKPAPLIDGYTGEQRFFLAYAQMWRWKGRDAYVEQIMKTDAHPPNNIRPYTVRNVDAWYEAFNVKPGDRLYLPPEQRVRMW